MEVAPALCCTYRHHRWRHLDSPVVRKWNYYTDDAKDLALEFVKQHLALMNDVMARDAKPDRLEKAQTVRACDFSLLGEPVVYPGINTLLTRLHNLKIATWMDDIGMHPKELDALPTPTQLTLTVLAPTPHWMEMLMQSVFEDPWDRFQASLVVLAKKPYRTALRLVLIETLLDGHFQDYADIICKAKPDFVEGNSNVYIGMYPPFTTSDSNPAPAHEKVLQFCHMLLAIPSVGKYYDMACEHEHSACVLLAHKKFNSTGLGRWHTWVDTGRFHQLVEQNRPVIQSEDYTLENPDWTLAGNVAQGFDPEENRHRRKRRVNHHGVETALAHVASAGNGSRPKPGMRNPKSHPSS